MRSQIVSRTQVLLLAVLVLSGFIALPAWAQSVFINEIHYDNTGTDAGEAIEIAGPAGADLTGWSVVLYNGANGQTYDTDALTGTISNDCNGFGVVVLNYAVNGIQNGPPDGIALVNASSTVVQFLSYEGTFTALNGPANGMLSVDIGVSENGSEPVGQSLQLTGTGTTYTDFMWNSPAAASFGDCNTGQTFVATTATVAFSEASYQYNEDGSVIGATVTVNRSGAVSGTSSVDVQFTDVSATGGAALGAGIDYVNTTQTLNFIANQTSESVTISINDDLAIEGDESFTVTLANAVDATMGSPSSATVDIINNDFPPTPTVVFSQASYQYNENGTAVGASVSVDRSGDVSGTSSIDVQFTNGSATGGAALGAGIDYVNTTQTINFIANQTNAAVTISINDDVAFEADETFTVTLANEVNVVIGSPGSATVTILNNDEPATPVVINEVDSDTPSSDDREFVELYDGGVGNTSLTGLVLVFFNGANDLSYAAFDLDGFSTDANGFFHIGNSGVTPTPGITFANGLLQNGPDAVALYLANGSNFPNNTPVTTSLLVDAIVYDTNDADAPGLLVLLNAGQPQVNESGGGNSAVDSNSRFPDGGIRRNTNTYVQQAPTPGVSNVPPVVVAEIFEIQGSGLTSPLVGQTVIANDNVVTAVGTDGFAMQTPNARSDADANTSNGIFVFTDSAPTVAVGDIVDVTGMVQEFFNFTEISGNPTVVFNSSGNALPTIVQFDGSTPSPNQPQSNVEFERFEGMLIHIASGVVSAPNQTFGTDPIAEVFIVAGNNRPFREPGILFPGQSGLPIWDGNPEVFELDPNRLGLPNATIPAGSTFEATGILGFEFSGYELWATDLSFDAATISVAVRAREDGESMVATFNMERFFDDVNNGIGEPVPSASEYAGILSKYSEYIRDVLRSPDILAVQEVENLNALQDLSAQIQSDDASIVYTPYLEEGNDIGGIDVGFLVRNSVTVNDVTQLHKSEIFTFDNSLLHDRPPLLLEAELSDGRVLTLMNLHQRSFSGIEGPDATRIRLKRHTQAVSVSLMVDSLQTENPDINLIVLGDFNSFEFTDGYVHVLGQIMGTPASASEAQLPGTDEVDPDLRNEVLQLPANQRYSFIFDGSAQVLDHILTSEKIQQKVSGRQYARGNADAAELFKTDYNTVLRASDHDALVMYIAPLAVSPVVLATNSVWIKEHANILSGDVVVNNASSGPVLDSNVELSVGIGATTPAGFAIKANRIKVKQGAVVSSDIFYNQLTNNGAINGSLTTPLALPVFSSLPPFHQAAAGTQDITVNQNGSMTLTAGAYRDILVKQNGTLLFSGGGTFAMRSLNTGDKVKLLFDAPTEILIGDKLDTDQNSFVGPQTGSGIGAADIVFYIAGVNGNNGNFGATPKSAQLGLSNTVLANFYVPNGTLWLRQGTVATGAFLGRDVIVGENVDVTLESSFTTGSSLAKASASAPDVADAKLSSPTVIKEFELGQNYPNPFNPSTTINYGVPKTGEVTLLIYNLRGQLVRTLVTGVITAGRHQILWDGADERGTRVASGIYVYRMQADGFVATHKLVLMK